MNTNITVEEIFYHKIADLYKHLLLIYYITITKTANTVINEAFKPQKYLCVKYVLYRLYTDL